MSSDRGTAAAIFTMPARRAVPQGALWGAVFGAYVVSAVVQYAAIGKTAADRARLAATTGTNIGLEALLGDARRIDTVAGYIEWRSVGVLCMFGAVWALLVATRLTRGEEDAGRWELLLAGGTTRGRALSLVVAGLAAGLVALWVIAAAVCVAVGHSSHAGFTVTASLFLATTLIGAVAMFLAVGLVCGQLAGNRREANQLAGAVLGIAFVIRMVADSVTSLAWLRWLSPFGWLEQAHPLTGSSWLALLPVAVFTAALCVVAAWIAGRRDVGTGLLPSRDTSRVHAALLNSPLGLALRLNRTAIGAWAAALAATPPLVTRKPPGALTTCSPAPSDAADGWPAG